jgi:hypothetical protein
MSVSRPLFLISCLGALVLAGAGPGCVYGPEETASENVKSREDMEACPEIRPQLCTMDYTPVCGFTASGRETFSNGCGACTNVEVIGYVAGECD